MKNLKLNWANLGSTRDTKYQNVSTPTDPTTQLGFANPAIALRIAKDWQLTANTLTENSSRKECVKVATRLF